MQDRRNLANHVVPLIGVDLGCGANQGGDADTTGALAGMLAGATSGAAAIPHGWLARLDRRIAAEIRDQTPKLLAITAGVSRR